MFALLAGAVLLATPAGAQRGFRGPAPEPVIANAPYDGRFTFARLKYTTAPGGFYYRGLPAWAHGYPRAESNLLKIMQELSTVKPRVDMNNVFALDDPALMKYPVAYMTEAGYWTMTDKEAAALRAYLLKGGFIIFDDFRDNFGNPGWYNFVEQIHRVLPNARFYDLDPRHPIFHAFFQIESFDIIPQSYGAGRPIFRAIYLDNDPKKRLLAMINFNTDVSDFWEFSGEGFYPVSESNEGFKLGVNYLVYALTH